VLRNAAGLVTSTLGASALGMLFWIVAARLYPPVEVGRASAAISAMALIGSLSTLGLHTLLVRYLHHAGRRSRAMLAGAYVMGTSLSLIMAVGYFLSGYGQEYLGVSRLALLGFVLAAAATTFQSLQDGALTAMRRTTWLPVTNVCINAAKLVLLPVALQTAFVAPLLLAWTTPIVVGVVVVTSLVHSKLVAAHIRATEAHQELPSARETFSFLSGSVVGGLLSTLSSFALPVLISGVLGASELALFYLPWLIGSVMTAVSWNVAVSFMLEVNAEPGQVREHLRHVLRLLTLVHLGGGLAITLSAPWILGLLGGHYSAGGVWTLRLIGLAVMAQVVKPLFAAVATLQSRVWWKLWVEVLRIVILLGGSYLAMRLVGLIGAAVAYLVSSVVAALLVLPATVGGLRALLRRADEPVQIPAAEQPAVGWARPNVVAGAMDSTLVLDRVVDWEHFGRVETTLLPRITDGGPGRQATDDPARPPRPDGPPAPRPDGPPASPSPDDRTLVLPRDPTVSEDRAEDAGRGRLG